MNGPAFVKLKDETVVNQFGAVIFPGEELFDSLLVAKDACLVCCRIKTNLNKEHVFPNWLLKLTDSKDQKLKIQETHFAQFSKHKFDICVECNAKLGDQVENPISSYFKEGPIGIQALKDEKPELLYSWLVWIVLKAHWKDRFIKRDKDERVNSDNLGDIYFWKYYRHMLCYARALIYGNKITSKALGTLVILPIVDAEHSYPLNYADNMDTIHRPGAKIAYLKVKDCAIFAGIGDGGALGNHLQYLTEPLRGGATLYQCAEVLGEFELAGKRLQNWPILEHEFDLETGDVILESVFKAPPWFAPVSKRIRNEIIWRNLNLQFDYENICPNERSKLLRLIKREGFSYLPKSSLERGRLYKTPA